MVFRVWKKRGDVVLSNAEGMKRINESNGRKNNILLECDKGVNKKRTDLMNQKKKLQKGNEG